ncbi:MAG: sugar ABC transporter ATP-binding protein [Chloroflexota bacterium]|nr:MAG: sugar ABC transporter ATP-binding protein [Chloroflexota bacterium]
MNENTQPLWELRKVSKEFPGVQALDDVSLSIKRGEIHALIGENGSGKSTLAKCIAGVHQPESGLLVHEGEPVELFHPFDAQAHGVATIYQEFSLVPTLSVAENIFLGRPLKKTRFGGIDWEEMRSRTAIILDQLSIHIDPEAIVRNLSVAEQQLIEIAKAMAMDSTLLIMDEPTAALGLRETQRLQELIRRLVEQDQGILYISHRLDEVFQIADRITVLKDGRSVGTNPTEELEMNDVIKMMIGLEIGQHYPKEVNVTSEICLEVSNISTESGVDEVSFNVRVGEVFGLGGMVGAGRTEIARALFGVDQLTSGEIIIHDNQVNFSSPSDAIKAGVGLVPENRKEDGLLFNFEGAANITLSRLDLLLRGMFLNLAKEEQTGREYVDKLNITPSALERSVQFLSGGNQQKIVIARWLFSQAKLLIFDEPTQGIDIGAKIEVYRVMNELTAQGISVVLISSDYPELLAMSDRIAIVRDGRILHISDSDQLSEHRLLSIASGAEANNNQMAAAGKIS